MPSYYNPYNPTNRRAMVLTTEQMQTNAEFIWGYMYSKYGWTLNATAGMLANAQAESTINPARPQNNAVENGWFPSVPGYPGDAPNPTTTWYGFGLWQITPYAALTGIRENPYTYGNWAMSNGYTFSHADGGTGGRMEPQLDWLMSGAPEHAYYNSAKPHENQAKWYQDERSPIQAKTPAIYGKLTASPEDCARTFYYNFERSDAGTPGNRPALAREWYNYLSGVTPPPPTPSQSKSNFLILAYAAGVIK